VVEFWLALGILTDHPSKTSTESKGLLEKQYFHSKRRGFEGGFGWVGGVQ